MKNRKDDMNIQISCSQQISIFDSQNIKESQYHSQENQQQSLSQQFQQNKTENSLSRLTRSFTKLIKSKPNMILDINEATKKLKVQKRRIYDITNVLEGIGYIEKIRKNKMRWVGGTMDYEAAQQVIALDKQIAEIQAKNRVLDEQITEVKSLLTAQTINKKYLNYFIQEDLSEILNKLPTKPQSMLLIKAEQGTNLFPTQKGVYLQSNSNIVCTKILRKK